MSVTFLSNRNLLASLDQFKYLLLEHEEIINENSKLKEKMKEVEEVNKSFMSVSLIINTKNENEKLRNELCLLKKKLSYLENELKIHKSRVDELQTALTDEMLNKQKPEISIYREIATVKEPTVFDILNKAEENGKEQEDEDAEEEQEDAEEEQEEVAAEEEQEQVEQEDEDAEEEEEEEDAEEEQEEDEIELYEEEYQGHTYFVTDDNHKHIYDRIKTETGDYEPTDEPIGYFKMEDGKPHAVWN